jgi:hypothetical protein
MRDFCLQFGIDRQLEDAARAKQQLDAERWPDELRPRAMRLFAARTAKLAWSRGLLKLVVSELMATAVLRRDPVGDETGFSLATLIGTTSRSTTASSQQLPIVDGTYRGTTFLPSRGPHRFSF